MMNFFSLAVTLLLPLVLSFVFLPRTLRYAGQLVGRSLRRSSRTRRELLLARVASEQRTYEAEQKGKKSKDDEDWEEVETSMVGSAANGDKADRDWTGIVAFFHPFW
jgi:alpha-1,2-mannosyltransferase